MPAVLKPLVGLQVRQSRTERSFPQGCLPAACEAHSLSERRKEDSPPRLCRRDVLLATCFRAENAVRNSLCLLVAFGLELPRFRVLRTLRCASLHLVAGEFL